MTIETTNKTERPPVVAIMGHIDHGKSTLLSYIRKSTKPLNEAGGITQHISAYEVEHSSKEDGKSIITFLDTPGHEAFSGIRKRGANISDIAVLVVSAEDGVKPQTLEALSRIKESQTPFIVAINKIDKPEADVEKTKQSLAENGIYIEGYGGDVPAVEISAKSGDGVSELLDMIVLVADLEELKGEESKLGQGFVIESEKDAKRGITAVCIVKNGKIEKGNFVASGTAMTTVKIMEDFLGRSIDKISFGRPVKIIGWDLMPEVGEKFETFKTRDQARNYIENQKTQQSKEKIQPSTETDVGENTLPLIVKTDTGSSLEAVFSEINKLGNDLLKPQIIFSGIGSISENDIRLANGNRKAIILAFNIKTDPLAKNLALRNDIEIKDFDIIYKMTEWLKEEIIAKTPKVKIEEQTGLAKILKIFSKAKDKQILGGRVLKGSITVNAQIKIFRRDVEIGQGKIRGLQQQKNKVSQVNEGSEFGAMIEAKVEIAPGDNIECFQIIEK